MTVLQTNFYIGWISLPLTSFSTVHNAIDDIDCLTKMFFLMLEIEDTFDEEAEVERIPQRTLALQGAAFVQ